MNKYYIIREDGSSIFQLPYPEDFCYHCLSALQDDGHMYRLLSSTILNPLSLFACDGTIAIMRFDLGELGHPREHT